MTTVNDIHEHGHRVSLPILAITKDDAARLTMASEDQRFALVGRVFETAGHGLDEVPDAWKTGPLQAWCWLVLTVNGIDFDPETARPLVHYGIDLGFASVDVSRWVWVLA